MWSALLVKIVANCQVVFLKNFLKLFTTTKRRSLPGDIFSLNTGSAAAFSLQTGKYAARGGAVTLHAAGLSTFSELVLGTCHALSSTVFVCSSYNVRSFKSAGACSRHR